jgi:hypothetical protein
LRADSRNGAAATRLPGHVVAGSHRKRNHRHSSAPCPSPKIDGSDQLLLSEQ